MELHVKHTTEHYALLFQKGEEVGLSFFYLELHPALSLFANQFLKNQQLAQEIASDAFIKTWKQHDKLNSFNAIKAYLYKTVYRDAMHALKKEKKRSIIELEVRSPDITNNAFFDHLVKAETYRLVQSALKHLSPGSRKVITMHYLENKSTAEIADELKLSVNTIRTQRTRGLAVLRKLLLPSILVYIYLSVKILLSFL